MISSNITKTTDMYYLNKFCFLCLEPYENDKSKDDINMEWQEKLKSFIPEHVLQETEIPKHICDHCMENINNIFKFRRKCLKNIAIFNDYTQKFKLKPCSYKDISDMLLEILRHKKSQINKGSDEKLNFNLKAKSDLFEAHDLNSSEEELEQTEKLEQSKSHEKICKELIIEENDRRKEIQSKQVPIIRKYDEMSNNEIINENDTAKVPENDQTEQMKVIENTEKVFLNINEPCITQQTSKNDTDEELIFPKENQNENNDLFETVHILQDSEKVNQVFIKTEEPWEDTDLEQDKHLEKDIFESDVSSRDSQTEEISKKNEAYEQFLIKNENTISSRYIKKEITEELVIKPEDDVNKPGPSSASQKEDISQARNVAEFNMLPEKSKSRYLHELQKFRQWKKSQNLETITEEVMVAYFNVLLEKYAPTSLWSSYSMLRATLYMTDNVDINKFTSLIADLKTKTKGYQPKKTKTFELEYVEKFINEAPDDIYLLMKMVIIMGVIGACRCDELVNVLTTDIEDHGHKIVVNIQQTKNYKARSFEMTEGGVEIYRKYASCRPARIGNGRFFLYYRWGKCTCQPVGINTLSKIPKQVANYLKLEDAHLYTGHCFRRTSVTFKSFACNNNLTLKRREDLNSANENDAEEETVRKKLRLAYSIPEK